MHTLLDLHGNIPTPTFIGITDGKVSHLCRHANGGDSIRRVYRLHDLTKSHAPAPGQYYCVFGNVNSADKLYLVIESIKLDSKHLSRLTVPPLPR
jgi:hypothetical protein